MLKLTPFEETTAGKEYLAEGIELGWQQALQENIIEILITRFDYVPPKIEQQIHLVVQQTTLRNLMRQAILVKSLAEFERILARAQGSA